MLTLRPYQQAAINAIYGYFAEHAGHPLIVIPTAGGKSLVMARFVQGVLQTWPDQRILVLTHVRELIAQNHAELVGLWPEAPAGIFSAGLGRREIGARILFAGIQSIHRRAWDVQQCDLVLIDEAGSDLFAAWSAQSAKDEPAFTAKTWVGLRPERIGAGTLYHLAMERGWKPDAALVLDGAAPCDAEHPASALIAKLSAPIAVEEEPDRPEPRPAVTVPPPPSLDRLDGALGLLVEHIVRSAIRPQPWLAVGAALAVLGTLMGRKVRTESNLRSNLYVLGIAESGGGKDHARKVIKEVLFQAGLAEHLGGERLASGAGLIAALNRQPASLFQIDEFGKFMANVVDKRRAPKHLSEIWDLFTELATSAGATFLGAEYADQKERPRQDIIEPCAAIHGVSAPGPFWEALRSGSLQDGSLARFLVFRTNDDIPDRNRAPAPLCDIPAELLAAVEAVAAVGANRPRGNLADTGASVVKPDPLVVAMDEDARAVFDDLDAEMTLRQRAAVGTEQSAVLARVWENAAKVALIKAVSADPADPVIRGADAQWAREVVEHCVATLIAEAARHLADNDIERHHKRALEFVRLAGPDGIARRDLTRKLQFIEPRLREDVIRTLIESEQIVAIETRGRGRPSHRYVASEQLGGLSSKADFRQLTEVGD